MNQNKRKHILLLMKKRLPLFVFLAITTCIYFLSSTFLMDNAYKDCLLVMMIWALPLFIH